MRSLFAWAAVGAVVLGVMVAPSSAKGPRTGVFGNMHGMRFNIAQPKRANSLLMDATYRVDPQSGSVDFALHASERPRAHRVYQNIQFSCSSKTSMLPWSADCVATYGEVRLKHRTFNQTIWSAAVQSDPVDLEVVGPFHVTVESFDGTVVRGRLSGSLDPAVCPFTVCGTNPESVSAEGTFAVRVTP